MKFFFYLMFFIIFCFIFTEVNQIKLRARNGCRLTSLIDCLDKIIEEVGKTKNLVFIREELEPHNHIRCVLNLNKDRYIVSSSNVSHASGIFIFLPDVNSTAVPYNRILENKREDYHSIYIICTETIQNIFHFFDLAWSNKLLNVIGLLPSKTKFLVSIYTYFPYGEQGCSNTDPVRINIWDIQNKSFQYDTKIFSNKEKLDNFYNCIVNVALNDIPQKIVKNEDNKIEYKEVYVQLFIFLQKKMNFTPSISLINFETNKYAAAYFNFTSAIVLSIVKGNSDIGVGRFSQLVDFDEDISYPVTTGMDCFTWAVPIMAGNKPSVWFTSLYEFHYITWSLIIICFIVCNIIFKIINYTLKLKKNNITLTMLAILLGISTNIKFKLTSVKVFITQWILFSLVIVAAYNGSLGSLVTVPPYSSNIDSTKELLKKDFKLTGEPKMYHILSASSDTSIQIKKVLEKFVILLPGEFENILEKIYIKRNIAVFYTKHILTQEESRVLKREGCSDLVHITQSCLITSHTSPLIVKKGSILFEPIKKIVMRLLENGIINYWEHLEEKKIFFNGTTGDEKHQRFTISQLRGALIVIIVGHIISTVVFIYEIITPMFKISPKNEKDQNKEMKNNASKLIFIK